MKKIFSALCFICFVALPCTGALAKNMEITERKTAVATYKGAEYSDGLWLLFDQGGTTLSLFSSDMNLDKLKEQEGKSVQVEYTYALLFHPSMKDYVVMRIYQNAEILPPLHEQELKATQKQLLTDKGPKQALLDVGAYYQYGLRGIKADADKALQWYQTIAALDIPEALVRAGDMHMNRESSLYSHDKAHTMYAKAAQAGYIPAFTRLGDLALVHGFNSEAEKNAASKEDRDERKSTALRLYTLAAKQKDVDAQARLLAMSLPPIIEDFLQPQGPCPTKVLERSTIQGIYAQNTTHDGYFGFLVQGSDGKSYDIGIGHEEPEEFMNIKAGNSITIPFYKEQHLNTHTGLCVVKLFHDQENVTKGSYSP